MFRRIARFFLLVLFASHVIPLYDSIPITSIAFASQYLDSPSYKQKLERDKQRVVEMYKSEKNEKEIEKRNRNIIIGLVIGIVIIGSIVEYFRLQKKEKILVEARKLLEEQNHLLQQLNEKQEKIK